MSTILPRIPHEQIKVLILGEKYDLSIAFVMPAKARALNKKYRKKSYVPDTLAFPLSKNAGEIVLNISAIRREAKRHNETLAHFATRLFIHSCLHLKGLTHGPRMEREERRIMKKHYRT